MRWLNSLLLYDTMSFISFCTDTSAVLVVSAKFYCSDSVGVGRSKLYAFCEIEHYLIIIIIISLSKFTVGNRSRP